jgi:anti-sigma regulatory factor (Ser/Thr protein kinase)
MDILGGIAGADTMHVHERVFPADRAAPRAATAWLRSVMMGLSPARLDDAELCLDELVTNVIRYAWADPAGREVAVRVERTPSELTVTIEDDGRPFDPRQAPAPTIPRSLDEAIPGGRGLMLVKAICQRLDYERRDGRNRVTFGFYKDRPTTGVTPTDRERGDGGDRGRGPGG